MNNVVYDFDKSLRHGVWCVNPAGPWNNYSITFVKVVANVLTAFFFYIVVLWKLHETVTCVCSDHMVDESGCEMGPPGQEGNSGGGVCFMIILIFSCLLLFIML